MPRILILSSFVAFGHVGLSAGQPVCQRLGVDVTAVPTTVLSNHPGWPGVAGAPVAPQRIVAMLDALGTNRWLEAHDALLIGYMPSVAHVDVAADLVGRLRPSTRIVVDPILGDWPGGLYVGEDVAGAVRDRLLPLAHVATPNLFELEWLTGRRCQSVEDAALAARSLDVDTVHVTSAPSPAGQTGVLAVCGAVTRQFHTPRYRNVPHGVGDVFAALIATGIPVGQALGHLHALAEASQGLDHLDIVGGAERWISALPIAATGTD